MSNNNLTTVAFIFAWLFDLSVPNCDIDEPIDKASVYYM
jgi:hypothetical protein